MMGQFHKQFAMKVKTDLHDTKMLFAVNYFSGVFN